MTADQIEQEIARVNPRAVTCVAKDGNSVAVLKDGRWVPVAALGLGGKWYNVPFPNLCADGKEVFPQILYMPL